MIKVFINRKVPSELEAAYTELAKETLHASMLTPGFIKGEVMHDINDPEHRLVVATYRSLADWQRWYESAERRALMDRLRPMLERDELIKIYEH
jgi:heme-degrading monooxygenase HmoA